MLTPTIMGIKEHIISKRVFNQITPQSSPCFKNYRSYNAEIDGFPLDCAEDMVAI